jgi:hypothetical protein
MYRSTRTGGVKLDMKIGIVDRDPYAQTFIAIVVPIVTIIHTIPNRVNGD